MSLKTFENLPLEKQEIILSVGIKEFSTKSYNDVRTDNIIQKCGISKGILFHYFGSKKNFYRYCLEKSMERLTEKTAYVSDGDFYHILFENISQKIAVCMKYNDEMHMINMATRESSAEAIQIKADVLGRYMLSVKAESALMLRQARSKIKFRNDADNRIATESVYIYINAVLNKYLAKYQQTPDLFFENSEQIKKEMKQHLDIMLYGVMDKEDT
ncbi:MAG: TetR/AcrR family transcriptional regulator [Oscillospiraceae bacterium]|nr:TetR/AcrR family transcriptional regulator [Oscillospiraceae bacterium]